MPDAPDSAVDWQSAAEEAARDAAAGLNSYQQPISLGAGAARVSRSKP